MRVLTRIGPEDFDPGRELAALAGAGAVASFIGHVRSDDGVAVLRLDYHPVMAAQALSALANLAGERWPLSGVTILHRVGALSVGDRIVFVAVASAHRTAALEACAFCIDRLKTDVPLWKCETLADGARRWVDPRDIDMARAARWE